MIAAVLAAALAISFMPTAEAVEIIEVEGPVPAEVIAGFADCPEIPIEMAGFLCIKIRAYDGDLKLGATEASISEPIEINVAVGVIGLTPHIVTASGEPTPAPDPLLGLLAPILDRLGSCTAGIPIPGGILGLPELDPIIGADPLGTLCLSATPNIGTPVVADSNAFLNYLSGSEDPVTLGIPLSIQLNNLLLGEKCNIASPDAPVMINLTNGTTSPPEGVEPISGSTGAGVVTTYNDPTLGGQALHGVVTGSRFVDNSFAVPGATKCDILVGDLLDQPAGLLDSVVNQQAGLPAAAGSNHAMFSLDSEVINYHAVHRRQLAVSPASRDFGSVAVGESSEPQTVTVTSVGTSAAKVTAGFASAVSSSYVLDEGCNGEVLAPGQSCDLRVRFAPNSSGAKNGNLEVRGTGSLSPLGASPVTAALTGIGTGTAALTAAPLNFGNGFLRQTTTQTVTFTNSSASPVTIVGPAKVTSTQAARLTSWAISDDACNGATVAPAGTCSATLSFTPDSTGIKAVTVEVRGANGAFLGGGAVNGTGVVPFTGPAVPFGSAPVGSQVGPMAVTFNNISPNPVTVTAPAALTGAASRFDAWTIVSDGCNGVAVAGGTSCVVQVRFNPISTGTKSVTLTLTSDALVVGNVSMTGTAT